HLTAGQYDAHHARLADELALRIAVQYRFQQARLEAFELRTGIAQASELDDRLRPEVQPCTCWQMQQVDAARRDILPHLPSPHVETAGTQLVMQFRMDQVHLPQIGLARVAGHARAMFDRHPQMRIALHAEPREQADARLSWLDERMGTTLLHRLDDLTHQMLLLSCSRVPHHPR